MLCLTNGLVLPFIVAGLSWRLRLPRPATMLLLIVGVAGVVARLGLGRFGPARSRRRRRAGPLHLAMLAGPMASLSPRLAVAIGAVFAVVEQCGPSGDFFVHPIGPWHCWWARSPSSRPASHGVSRRPIRSQRGRRISLRRAGGVGGNPASDCMAVSFARGRWAARARAVPGRRRAGASAAGFRRTGLAVKADHLDIPSLALTVRW